MKNLIICFTIWANTWSSDENLKKNLIIESFEEKFDHFWGIWRKIKEKFDYLFGKLMPNVGPFNEKLKISITFFDHLWKLQMSHSMKSWWKIRSSIGPFDENWKKIQKILFDNLLRHLRKHLVICWTIWRKIEGKFDHLLNHLIMNLRKFWPFVGPFEEELMKIPIICWAIWRKIEEIFRHIFLPFAKIWSFVEKIGRKYLNICGANRWKLKKNFIYFAIWRKMW